MRANRTERSRVRRGIFLTEAIIAMSVILILTAVVATSATQHRKGSDRLANTRAATRLAEQTLTALQAGQPAPTPGEGSAIEIVPLEGNWVRVRTVVNGRQSELIGLKQLGGIKP